MLGRNGFGQHRERVGNFLLRVTFKTSNYGNNAPSTPGGRFFLGSVLVVCFGGQSPSERPVAEAHRARFPHLSTAYGLSGYPRVSDPRALSRSRLRLGPRRTSAFFACCGEALCAPPVMRTLWTPMRNAPSASKPLPAPSCPGLRRRPRSLPGQARPWRSWLRSQGWSRQCRSVLPA